MAGDLIRDHKLEDLEMLDAKILIKLHGAKTSLTLMNPDTMEPEGEVLMVGPGYRLPDGVGRAPVAVKVGDMVLLGQAKVTPIKVDGTVCYVVGENAIECIVGKNGVKGDVVSGRIITS